MGWTVTADAKAFWRAAEPYLRAHRVASTVVLTVVDTLRRRGPGDGAPPQLAWWDTEGRVVVAVADGALAADRGAEEVLLFTDLANPTSNALYARLGFAGVADLVDAALVPVARKNV